MTEELSLSEVERRLRSGDWYYEWELRRWIPKRDGALAVALDRLHDLTHKMKALDDAAWLAEVEAVTAEALAAGVDPAVYALRLRDERKAERRRDQNWWAQHPPTLPPDMQRKHAPLIITESKAAANESTFSGFLAVFGNEDLAGDILSSTACDDSLRALKAAPYSARYLLPLLYQHKADVPLGGFADLRATSRWLAFKAHLTTATQAGREVATLIKSGMLTGMSIGYIAERSHVNRNGIRVLERIKLLEGSVVTLPANPLARIYGDLD